MVKRELTEAFLRRPFLVVVGAHKAGTTFLHDLLSDLGTVALPRKKETRSFCSALDVPMYLEHFDPSGIEHAMAVAEVDPEYLSCRGAVPRIMELRPDAVIGMLIRDPVDRAISHFRMTVARGLEREKLSVALALESGRCAMGGASAIHFSYLARSRYSLLIREMRDLVPPQQQVFVDFSRLTTSPSAVVEELSRRVGFTGSPDLSRIENRNSAFDPRSRWVSRMFYGDTMTRRAMRRAFGTDSKVANGARRVRLWNERSRRPMDRLIDLEGMRILRQELEAETALSRRILDQGGV